MRRARKSGLWEIKVMPYASRHVALEKAEAGYTQQWGGLMQEHDGAWSLCRR